MGSVDENVPRHEFLKFASDAHGLIIGREKIDYEFIYHCPHLKVISKYGVGLDNIDFAACESVGLKVLSAPGVNKQSVAELTMGFMLGTFHNIYFTNRLLHQGFWKKDGGRDLKSKTLGIIGLGNIGTRLVELLLPFDLKIMVNDILDKSIECKRLGICAQVDLETLLKNSDVVSLHVPLNETTKNLITRKELSLMKPDALLINTSRGSIVNEKDLLNHLNKNVNFYACLDVFESEPAIGNPLISHPQVVSTPHIGGNSVEARRAMGKAAVDLLSDYFYGEKN